MNKIILILGLFISLTTFGQSQFCIENPNHPNCKQNSNWQPGNGNPSIPINNEYALLLLGISGIGLVGFFLTKTNKAI